MQDSAKKKRPANESEERAGAEEGTDREDDEDEDDEDDEDEA